MASWCRNACWQCVDAFFHIRIAAFKTLGMQKSAMHTATAIFPGLGWRDIWQYPTYVFKTNPGILRTPLGSSKAFSYEFPQFSLNFQHNVSLNTKDTSQVQVSTVVHDLPSCVEDLAVQLLLRLLASPGSRFSGKVTEQKTLKKLEETGYATFKNRSFMSLSVDW